MSKRKDNKRLKMSFIINILISIMTINAIIMSIMGIRFMYGYEPSSEITGVPIYSYFTIQSNIFMGIVSFLFANREYEILKGKKKDIPLAYYVLKLVATVSVSLTFFVVFAYLGFVTKGGHIPLLKNSNLFFHLLIPLVSILNFIIIERTNIIKFKYTFYCIVPTILYEIYYTTNLLLNMRNGKVALQNDWYYFAQNGILIPLIVAPTMLGITYILSLLIWKMNKNKHVMI